MGHSTDIIAYGCDGELLCKEHGEALIAEVEAEYPDEPDAAEHIWPVFLDQASENGAVEYCGHGDNPDSRGHSFCTHCGSDVDADDFNRVMNTARCWNCHTESAFVDGVGYVDWDCVTGVSVNANRLAANCGPIRNLGIVDVPKSRVRDDCLLSDPRGRVWFGTLNEGFEPVVVLATNEKAAWDAMVDIADDEGYADAAEHCDAHAQLFGSSDPDFIVTWLSA